MCVCVSVCVRVYIYIYIYIQEFTLNNQQRLICYKIKPNKTHA